MGFERKFHVLLVIRIHQLVVQIMHFEEGKQCGVFVCECMGNVMLHQIGKFNHLPYLRKRKQVNGQE